MIEYSRDEKPSGTRGETLSFGDIVGQEELKRALLAVAANDRLDGLLVRGEKGTAKSTAVRALTDLLPAQAAVEGCRYGCPPDDAARQCPDCRARDDPSVVERPVPLVTLPLGATRERVVGSLSVADALDGAHEFEPGLLARANRGILYVDEVNLLDDHLVDVLLDAAAAGVNRVERDGVSVVHPAEFTLVGTMNPEEGDLRPQLRDRFALQATVTGCADLDDRVAIIDRALGRDDPEEAGATGVGDDPEATEPDDPARRLRDARERLADVTLPDEFARETAELCRDAGVEGHRGDIATARAARTFAALDGREKVLQSDVRRAAELALPHRLQSRPFEDAPDASDVVDDHFGEDDVDGEETDDGAADGDEPGDEAGDGDESGDETADGDEPGDGTADGREDDEGGGGAEGDDPEDGNAAGEPDPDGDDSTRDGDATEPSVDPSPGDSTADDSAPDGSVAASGEADDDDRAAAPDPDGEGATPLVPGQSRAAVGEARAPDLPAPEAPDSPGDGAGPGDRPGAGSEGPRVRTEPAEAGDAVDAAASVRAAAARGGDAVGRRDLRRSVRAGDDAALVLFAVDASASMRPAMRAAKGTVLELLKDAYRERDEVAFLAFAGDDAEVLLPPTDSVTLAARHLKDLPTGDRTPLPAGLRTAAEVVDRADPAACVVVLVTDGRANVAAGSPVAETRAAARGLAALGARVVVVDAGDDRPGVVPAILEETDGERVPLSALTADRVDAAVGAARRDG
ncbi:MAG: VWA domain-containing protein [Haloferacaceae archaeon]